MKRKDFFSHLIKIFMGLFLLYTFDYYFFNGNHDSKISRTMYGVFMNFEHVIVIIR